MTDRGRLLVMVISGPLTLLLFLVYSPRKRPLLRWPPSAVLFALGWLACLGVAVYLVLE